jgi:hypothetical protein
MSEDVEPTAARAPLPAKRPTTMMSAALNSSCNMPDSIKGMENKRILPRSGPLVMSIS